MHGIDTTTPSRESRKEEKMNELKTHDGTAKANKNSKLLEKNAGITCYGLVRTRNSQQEWYETASRQAAVRARFLRRLGYTVTVSPMGFQVTSVGRVKMTLLTIHLQEDSGFSVVEPPPPGRVVRF